MPKASDNFTPDSTKVFSEKLNGRAAMLGLAIGLATEALTGRALSNRCLESSSELHSKQYRLSRLRFCELVCGQSSSPNP
ncbi:hypothetical protein MITS9504_00226 [Synechococcus sp. MIT S9504]|nr:hypothetical protein MITS9504_00226 [Synechococcus sp. MIT S9504]